MPEYRQIHLNCGIPLTLLHTPGSGMVSFYAFIMAGSADDTPGMEGTAHLCEHLAFSGASLSGRKELYNRIGGTGAGFNAFTKRDYSCFHFTVVKDRFASALELLANMLFKTGFGETDLETEKQVVLKEIAALNLSEDFTAQNAFYKILFPGSFGSPVCGLEESVKKINTGTCEMFHDKHYKNAKIKALVMGDFSEKGIVGIADFLFSRCIKPSGSVKKFNSEIRNFAPAADDCLKYCLKTSALNLKRNYFFTVLEGPGCDSPDFLPFQIFTELLYTSGELSLESGIVRKLNGRVSGFSITSLFWKDKSYLIIKTNFEPELTCADVHAVIMAGFSDATNTVITHSHLDEYVRTEITNRRLGEEKTDIFGIWEAQSFVNMKFPDFAGYVENIGRVKPADVQKAARRYFSEPVFYSAAFGKDYMDSMLSSPAPSHVLMREREEVSINKQAFKVKESLPEKTDVAGFISTCGTGGKRETGSGSGYHRYQLSSGTDLVISQHSGSPIFAAAVLAKDRCFYENAGKRGITELLSRVPGDGSRGMTREETHRKANLAGANLNTVFNPPGRASARFANQFLCVRIETTVDFSEQALEILSDTVFFPTPDEIYIKSAKNRIAAILREHAQKPAYRAQEELFGKLMPKHPYRFDPIGSPDGLEYIGLRELKEAGRRIFNPRNLILSVRSCLEPEKVLEMAEERFGREFACREGIDMESGLAEIFAFPVGENQGKLFVSEAAAGGNAAVSAAFYTDVPPGDEAAFEIACIAFASCLAFIIRDTEGLAYNVYSGWDKTRYGSYFIMTAETDGERADRVKSILTDFVGAFRREFVSAPDLEKFVQIYKCSSLRALMPSMGRVLTAGMDVLRGHIPGYTEKLLSDVEKLNSYAVMEVLKYFTVV